MNGLSFFFIVLSGFLFGLAFPFLLEELGFSKKASRSWLSVFSLALLSFAAFMIYPIFTHGMFFLNEVSNFYTEFDGVFLKFTIALLAGGAVVLVREFFLEQRKRPHAQAPVSSSGETTT